LTPYLTPTQDAVKEIRGLRLDREWDHNMKSMGEMLACLSWVLFNPPQQLPAAVVKETVSSAEFWLNRIRKDHKGKNETQIAFCDNMKKALTGLVAYIEEYHKAGLTWNPKGVSLAEAAIRLTDEATTEPEKPMDTSGRSPMTKRHPALKGASATPNVGGLMSELGTRKNADGTSAASGLKKVSLYLRNIFTGVRVIC
jgi:adenylyl cyclase-associated protein